MNFELKSIKCNNKIIDIEYEERGILAHNYAGYNARQGPI